MTSEREKRIVGFEWKRELRPSGCHVCPVSARFYDKDGNTVGSGLQTGTPGSALAYLLRELGAFEGMEGLFTEEGEEVGE